MTKLSVVSLALFANFFSLFAYGTSGVPTGVTYTTSVGAVFTQMQYPTGLRLMADPSGVGWNFLTQIGPQTNNFPSDFGNTFVVQGDTVTNDWMDSQCSSKFGELLPTAAEAIRFASYFTQGSDDASKAQREEDMSNLGYPLGRGGVNFYWTSTLQKNPSVTYGYEECIVNMYENSGCLWSDRLVIPPQTFVGCVAH